jgi:amidophosphoribosyltransferase
VNKVNKLIVLVKIDVKMPPIQTFRDKYVDKPEEACGVFGVVAPGKQVSKITYYGLLTLQHRGQESAGIATFDFNHFLLHKEMGLVNQIFNDSILESLQGQIAIGHTRYSTMGESNLANSQPFSVCTNFGTIALAHNGNLTNAQELRQKLEAIGHKLLTTSDSEILCRLLADYYEKEGKIEESLLNVLPHCQGAFAIVIALKDKLIAVRDTNGIRPLCLGQTDAGEFIIASESCALDINGATYIRDVCPGEIIVIDLKQNLSSFFYSIAPLHKLCIFEIIYFARPDSIVYNRSLYSYRFDLGRKLAKDDAVIDADLVIPVPDSGTISAIGYAYETGLPFAKALVKNRNVGRTFIEPSMEARKALVRLKLNPIKDIIEGKKIVLVDDSIVRGTTCRQIVRMVREAGVKAVHLRISSPPVKYPCFYGIDINDQKQLIAANECLEDICTFLGADSLKFITPVDMLTTCKGAANNNFCTACFTGEYPLNIGALNNFNKLILEK